MKISERVKLMKKSVECVNCQYFIDNACKNKDDCFWKDLEQALTEHEKQKQILEVSKKCFWELDLINETRDYKQYSGWFEVRCGTPTLTETEFNLIKEWLCEKKN